MNIATRPSAAARSRCSPTSPHQEAARAACREMNERVFGAYRAHRARADQAADVFD
jgi:hypothetical protein